MIKRFLTTRCRYRACAFDLRLAKNTIPQFVPEVCTMYFCFIEGDCFIKIFSNEVVRFRFCEITICMSGVEDIIRLLLYVTILKLLLHVRLGVNLQLQSKQLSLFTTVSITTTAVEMKESCFWCRGRLSKCRIYPSKH